MPSKIRIRLLLRTLLITAALSPSSALAAQPFTIGVIGDQQVPSENPGFYPSFTVQTDWLAANAATKNVRFVTQVGDIIEHGDNSDQWGRAAAAMATLDSAVNADGGTGVPWSVSYGNHEVDWDAPGDDPAGADADNYRQYFGSRRTHRYAGQPEFGGVSSNDLNTWHVIKSSNAVEAREYLMLNLEYDVPGHAPGSSPDPGDVPAFDAIAWAWEILARHPGMPTIITTHVFEGTAFGPPNNPYTPGPGRNSQLQIFDKLVKNNPQVFMVLSGHTSEETHQVKLNAAGLPVLQMVTDYTKWLSNGGDGYMRLVEIDEDAGEIRVQTFTPGIPTYNPPTPPGFRTNANGQFTVTMDWATRFPTPVGPVMGAPVAHTITDDGATIEALLTNEDADEVTLVWAYADQGETDLATWIAAPGGGSHSFGSATVGQTLSHVLSGLDGDTAYSVRFFATDGADPNWSLPARFNTGLGNEPAPADFAGEAEGIAGGTKVDLSWMDGFATETGFVIRRSTDPGFGAFDEFSVAAGETSYSDKTTAPNTTYYYRIAAVGSSGNGAFTANLEVSTGEAGSGPIAGLIGHWKFDERSGATASDSSVNSNDATQAGTAGTWVPGKSGRAYRFGGGNSRFELADSSDLQVTGAVTVSAWVNPTAASTFGLIAGIDQTGGSANDMYTLKTDGGDRPRWDVVAGGGGSNISLDADDTLANFSAATADGWVHVVGVFDPGVAAYLYVNGVVNASDTSDIPASIQLAATDFQFGHNASDNGSNPLQAAIDDVQVYEEALTPADVTFLHNNPGSPLAPPIPGFAGWIAGFSGLGSLTGFSDDPDGDLIPNGLEAWFGTHPGESSTGLFDLSHSGTVATFKHPRNETPPRDLSGFYQWSPNLIDWYDGDEVDGPPGGPTVSISATPEGSTTNVSVAASETIDSLFLRAGVAQD